MIEVEALADIEQLADRLPFEMDADEEREAIGALEDLSDDARYYGKNNWVSPTLAPSSVARMVLRAASRHMKNYDGFVSSRAGDEQLNWTDRGEQAGSAYFTENEIKQLRQLAGNQRAGFFSVQMTGWGDGSRSVDTSDIIKDYPEGTYAPSYVPGATL